MKHFYQAIEKRIIDSIPAIKLVDWYMEQYTDGDDELVWQTPCVFIEFSAVDWTTGGNGATQWGDLTFTLHLVTESAYEDKRRHTLGEHFGLDAQLFKAFQNWGCSHRYIDIDVDIILLNNIVRVRSEPQHILSEFVVTKQTFSCEAYALDAYLDAENEMTTTEVTLELDVEKVDVIPNQTTPF